MRLTENLSEEANRKWPMGTRMVTRPTTSRDSAKGQGYGFSIAAALQLFGTLNMQLVSAPLKLVSKRNSTSLPIPPRTIHSAYDLHYRPNYVTIALYQMFFYIRLDYLLRTEICSCRGNLGGSRRSVKVNPLTPIVAT